MLQELDFQIEYVMKVPWLTDITPVRGNSESDLRAAEDCVRRTMDNLLYVTGHGNYNTTGV